MTALRLHGTAGCVGGNDTEAGHPYVGVRCCDTPPFFVQLANGTWARLAANATAIANLTVTLDLAATVPAGDTAPVVAVRYAVEAYPNCALYDDDGGPVAGAWSVYGAEPPGCTSYETCNYEGTALPSPPFELPLEPALVA